MGLFDSLQGTQEKKVKSPSLGQFDAQIAEIEKMLKEQYTIVGELYLRQNMETCGAEYVPYATKVKELMEQKKNVEINKLAAQGLRLCESCHQTIPLDSAFCNKCGQKMEPLVLASNKGNRCPSCGAAVGEEALFCMECGTKIER